MTTPHHQTKLALGSDTTLLLVGQASSAVIAETFSDLWQTIYRFERQFSRFIPMSELSVFNRSPGVKMGITPEFRDILVVAKQLGEETDGLYNPLILPALHRAGYTKSFVETYADDTQDDYSTRAVVPVAQLEIGDNWAAIPYGTALDLGGCGKGYLADLLANHLAAPWVQGYWLSIGGDIVGEGFDASGKPWTVTIQSAFKEAAHSKWMIQMSGGRFAVATSGTMIRAGQHNGKSWHHIIDPRTLRPAESDCSMATVYCASAVRADVLASCAIILGSQKAVPFLKEQGIEAAYLQGNTDTTNSLHTRFGKALRPKTINQPRGEQLHV